MVQPLVAWQWCKGPSNVLHCTLLSNLLRPNDLEDGCGACSGHKKTNLAPSIWRVWNTAYLAMPQDLTAPLNGSFLKHYDTRPFMDKNVSNFLFPILRYSVAMCSKPLEVSIIGAATLPRG